MRIWDERRDSSQPAYVPIAGQIDYSRPYLTARRMIYFRVIILLPQLSVMIKCINVVLWGRPSALSVTAVSCLFFQAGYYSD
jgi:hypothetical protein